METQPLTDDSIMPWGQYKGVKMQDVEAKYLVWVKDNMTRNEYTDSVFDYIEDNIIILYKELGIK